MSLGARRTARQVTPSPEEAKDYLVVEYVGENRGSVRYRAPSGQPYRFSALPTERLKYVRREDVPFFAALVDFRVRDPDEPRVYKEEPVAVG